MFIDFRMLVAVTVVTVTREKGDSRKIFFAWVRHGTGFSLLKSAVLFLYFASI